MLQLALLAALAAPSGAVPSFHLEPSIIVSTAQVQALVGPYAGPARVYYIRGSSLVYSATTSDGVTFAEEPGVRLSSLTVPLVDVDVSSITGLSVLPLAAGGFRMLYSVIGTTGAFNIYSATSADGLAWANDTGTAISVANGLTFSGFPSLVKLGTGDWRLYYVQNTILGNQPANHQIFTALSTNEGRNWSPGSVAVPARTGEVAASQLTDGRVRLYYTAPAGAGTTNTQILSAVSANNLGTGFALEPGIRLATSPASGTLDHPYVTRSTDTFRWRLYFDYTLAAGIVPGDSLSAVTDVPDPQSITPNVVLVTAGVTPFTIKGEIFDAAPTAAISLGGTSVPGTGLVRVDDQTLTVNFDIGAASVGLWNLGVTDANGQTGTDLGALNVTFQGGSVTMVDNLIRPRQGTKTQISINIFNGGHVTAKLYNLLGEPISTVVDSDLPIGTTTVTWDGTNSRGHTVASGVYVLRTIGPKLDNLSKIVVIK